jgi:hypothetical protein
MTGQRCMGTSKISGTREEGEMQAQDTGHVITRNRYDLVS